MIKFIAGVIVGIFISVNGVSGIFNVVDSGVGHLKNLSTEVAR